MSYSPYKRRKPAILRNLWIYRRVILLAFVLGVLLWFVWANNTDVTVHFPFKLGSVASKLGIIILFSAFGGSLVTVLALAVWYALRRSRRSGTAGPEDREDPLAGDRPPPDYAAKTPEGFPDAGWS